MVIKLENSVWFYQINVVLVNLTSLKFKIDFIIIIIINNRKLSKTSKTSKTNKTSKNDFISWNIYN